MIVTIDPGIHTGYAIFLPEKTQPVKIGQWNLLPKYKSLDAKLSIMQDKIIEFIEDNFKLLSCSCCYIEGVSIYGNSVKSITSAVRGDLTWLSYLIGIYYASFNGTATAKIISPNWKGQLNYKQLATHVKAINGQEYKSEHILSAVGMGLFIMGKL